RGLPPAVGVAQLTRADRPDEGPVVSEQSHSALGGDHQFGAVKGRQYATAGKAAGGRAEARETRRVSQLGDAGQGETNDRPRRVAGLIRRRQDGKAVRARVLVPGGAAPREVVKDLAG